jgi:parvulin-like peptidyl-prolyl isomerase
MKIEQNMSHACIIPSSAARLLRHPLQKTTLPHALVLWAALSGSCFSQLVPAEADHPRDSVLAPVPDQVRLSEILIATPQPTDRIQVSEAENKARELRDALRKGEKFDDLAKANSQGPSAKQGGGLGYFRRGVLAPAIEYLVFDMEVGEVSEVLRTKQGLVILEVTAGRDCDA